MMPTYWLPPKGSKNVQPMNIYFRCTDDYYHLYIRDHATHTGYCLSKDRAGVLGFLPAGSDTTSSTC
jgi:hypothetical protein